MAVEAPPIVIEVADLSYRYPGAAQETLCGLSLSVNRGECVCLSGPSGCGKSTLLLAMAGLLKGGEIRGECRFGVPFSDPLVGIVFQNAESQILSTTVGDEVAFGPMNLNLPTHEIDRRVASALDAVGLTGYETRNVEELSAGEKHRLTIASVLSMEPSLIFLDEPSAQLDTEGKEALRSILEGLKKRLFTIVVADHDIWTYRDVADRFLFMNDGRIEKEADKVSPLPAGPACQSREKTGPARRGAPCVIRLERVCFSRQKDRPVISDLSMEVCRGERIHIFGENGAGKSTLFKLMTGLLHPDSGRIDMLGLSRPSPEKLKGRVGLLLQNPARQLFENTVGEEAAFSLRRQGLPPAEIEARTRESLVLCDIALLRDRSPFTLSYGEKHRVTLASLIALKPQVLFLDEPFSGLDFVFRQRMLDTLEAYDKERCCAIIIASHDPLVDPYWTDRCLLMEEGRLTELATT
jgi:energy-coupling factor transport system ATP-binding protein